MEERKRILITGAAGFLGSHLCDRFIKEGYHVIGMDNLITGRLKNIEHLLPNKNFRLLEGDIRNSADCEQAVNGADYVLHQAALGSVPRSLKDPVTSNEVNVSGFLNMLVASRDAGVKRFVYAASSSTYGDSQGLPKVEEVIGKPLSPYAITKYVNELYAEIFSRTYGMETIGLRYFNVFGRKQDPNGAYAAVIPKFVMQLMQHESPVINGDGNYSRDFTYIDDIVEGIIRIQDKPPVADKAWNGNDASSSSAPYKVFNIGNNQPVKLMTFIEAIEQAVGKDAVKEYLPMQDGDVPATFADIDDLQQAVGFKPATSIELGVAEFVRWYKAYYKV